MHSMYSFCTRASAKILLSVFHTFLLYSHHNHMKQIVSKKKLILTIVKR